MKTIILRFRVVDRKNFQDIKNGIKTVETRAGTVRFRDIQKGDIVIIVCGKGRITRRVKHVWHFKSIESLFKAIPLKKVMPQAKNISNARKTYYGYPGYKEKIKASGLVALTLGRSPHQ